MDQLFAQPQPGLAWPGAALDLAESNDQNGQTAPRGARASPTAPTVTGQETATPARPPPAARAR
jgi:hypothetical protein